MTAPKRTRRARAKQDTPAAARVAVLAELARLAVAVQPAARITIWDASDEMLAAARALHGAKPRVHDYNGRRWDIVELEGLSLNGVVTASAVTIEAAS